MRKNLKLLLVLGASIALLTTECGKKYSDKSKSAKLKLAFISGAATDFWVYCERGCQRADSELGDVQVEFKYTSDATAVEQRRIVDDLLAKGIDGLIVTPLDPVNQAVMINRAAKQVPVIITDSDVIGSDRLCYIGTNNVDAGRQAGELIKEILPNGGKIMLFVGRSDAQNAKERIQGLKETIKGSKIEILDIRTDDVDRVRAKANVNDTMVKYPDVSCLVGLWSYNGPAILNAVKEAGKLGQIKIVAFDEEPETIKGIMNGHIYGSVVQQPFLFGYKSVHILAKVLKGDKSVVPESGQINIPTLIIKQPQASDFLKKLEKLRGEKF